MNEFFDRNLVVVYFFYGLAFFSMGLAILFSSARFRTSEFRLADALLFLAGFGIVHGLQEWFEMFEIIEAQGASSIPAFLLLPEVRLFHLIVSFLLLIFFGVQLLFANRRPETHGNRFALLGAGAFLLLWGLSVIVTMLVDQPTRLEMINAADVLARYTLAIPGAILAAWAIWLEQSMFRRRGVAGFGRSLLGAAVALLIYGLVGQLFTRPSIIFPSTILNTETFADLFGFPIQILRASMAALMAIFIIRALNVFEVESRAQLEEAQTARAVAQQQALDAQEQARRQTEQLNEQLAAAVRDLSLLFAVSRKLAGTLDRAALLKDAMPVLVNMLPQVNAGMVVLKQSNSKGVQLVSVVECNDLAAPVAERKRQGLELAAYTMETGRCSWMIAHEVLPLDMMENGNGSIILDPATITYASTASGGHTMAMPLTVRGEVIGSLVFCTLYDACPFSLRDVALARTIADQLSIAIENATLYDQVEQSGRLRGELLHRVVSAQEAERQRIARELHDSTGQMLTALGLGLAAAADRVESDPEMVRRQLQEMKQMNAQVLQEVHDVIADLRPSILDNLGLVPALRGHINQFSQRTGIDTQLNIFGKVTRLTPEVETTIFRIVQESLTNVVRHSEAQHVVVELTFSDRAVRFFVQDDGRGFDVEQALNRGAQDRRAWGLLGIQERAVLVGGTAAIASQPGQGVTVSVKIPSSLGETINE